jgi:hypothetical protein
MDPNTKAQAAKALLESALNPTTVEQSRELFRQAKQDAASHGNVGVLLRVCLCWAEAETKRSQFKAAKRIYEDIIGHAVLGKLAASWLSYAGFCAGRGKVRTARKVYVRGCQSEMPEEQSSTIWKAFLNFENAIRSSTKSSNVTSLDETNTTTAVESPPPPNELDNEDHNTGEETTSLSTDQTPTETTENVNKTENLGEGSKEATSRTINAENLNSAESFPERGKCVSDCNFLLTLEELKAMVEQTSLPSEDVLIESIVTPSEVIGEKFKAAAEKGQIVQVEDDCVSNTITIKERSDTAKHMNIASDSKNATTTNNTTSSITIKTTTAITTTTAQTTSAANESSTLGPSVSKIVGIPKEIEKAAAQAAAAEMLNYALPSGSWAPRLFAFKSCKTANKAKPEVNKPNLPRAILLKLGTSLKQGGAKHVFRIVTMLRESQRLKEEELRMRRQMTIKEYRTQVAMAWLNASTTSSIQSKRIPPPTPLLDALAEKLRQSLERFDILARRELEGMRRQHQSICEKAGIPEMRSTSNVETDVIDRQRQVLEVLERAANIRSAN